MAAAPAMGEAPSALLLRKLKGFYDIQANFDTLDLLLDKRRGKAANMPSLRVLEHLVTTFSRQKHFDFKLPHQDIPMHLYDAYQAELMRHGKVLFDVFAREDKYCTGKHQIASPNGDGRTLMTTPKQMNFVQWAIVNNIIQYARDHLVSIKNNLPQQARQRPPSLDPPAKKQRNSFSGPSKLHNGSFKLSFGFPSGSE